MFALYCLGKGRSKLLSFRLKLRVLAFVLLLGLFAWPWQAREAVLGDAIGMLANPVLNRLDLGGRINAHLSSVHPGDRKARQQNVVAESALTITASGTRGKLTLGLALRRDIYLPAILFVSLLLSAPGVFRRKAAALVGGLVIVLGAGIAAIAWLVAHYSMHQLASIYSVSPSWGSALDFGYERALAPPGNRVVAPLFLAAAGFLWARPPRSQGDGAKDRSEKELRADK